MIKPACLAALFAVSIQPVAASAQSSDMQQRSRTVYFGDLDLAESADAVALMTRLERAARQACGRSGREMPRLRREIDACRVAALETAIAAVNAPELTALRQGDEAPRVLASR